MPMSDVPPAIEPADAPSHQNSEGDQRLSDAIAPLRRLNNLVIFLIVACGLASAAAVTMTGMFRERPAWASYLTLARSVLPVLALIATFVYTSRAIAGLAARETTLEASIAAFGRSKRFATLLFGGVGVFGAACLLATHRTADVVLAAIPLLLVIVARPTPGSLLSFMELAAGERRGAAAEASK
jgi:hypothetical protein